MGVMRQCGDPVCPPALCQHHGVAYSEWAGATPQIALALDYTSLIDGVPVVSRAITITERCCIAIDAAMIIISGDQISWFEIEQPYGTICTTQEDMTLTGTYNLTHQAAWEVLDPGIYTYHVVNRSGGPVDVYAAWLKIIASDCEG